MFQTPENFSHVQFAYMLDDITSELTHVSEEEAEDESLGVAGRAYRKWYLASY